MIKGFSRAFLRSNFRALPVRLQFSQENLTQKSTNNTEEQIKANQAVTKSLGMNQFLTRVYNTTGLALMGALGSSYAVMSIPSLAAIMPGLSLFGIVGVLGGMIGASYMKPINVTETLNGVPIYKTKNTPLRIGLYALGSVSLGLTAAPLFAYASALSPSIMPTAIGLTTAIFGGSSLAAYNMPKGRMLGFGGALTGALLGLIGLQVVGLLSAWVMGPNALSMMLFQADNYLGILLFSGFIAYDTHLAIKMYEQQNADHVGMSIQFLLDFWNILVRIVSILSRRD